MLFQSEISGLINILLRLLMIILVLALMTFLLRKQKFMQRPLSGPLLIGLGVVFAVFHNLVSAVLDFEEPVFFFLCFLSLGIGAIWLIWAGGTKVVSWLKTGLSHLGGVKSRS